MKFIKLHSFPLIAFAMIASLGLGAYGINQLTAQPKTTYVACTSEEQNFQGAHIPACVEDIIGFNVHRVEDSYWQADPVRLVA